jgi:hypothetical protein
MRNVDNVYWLMLEAGDSMLFWMKMSTYGSVKHFQYSHPQVRGVYMITQF